MAMVEIKAIGKTAAVLCVGIGAYMVADTALEYLAHAFDWSAGSGTVPYLNGIVHSASGFLDSISEITGACAGAWAGYQTYRKLK